MSIPSVSKHGIIANAWLPALLSAGSLGLYWNSDRITKPFLDRIENLQTENVKSRGQLSNLVSISFKQSEKRYINDRALIEKLTISGLKSVKWGAYGSFIVSSAWLWTQLIPSKVQNG